MKVLTRQVILAAVILTLASVIFEGYDFWLYSKRLVDHVFLFFVFILWFLTEKTRKRKSVKYICFAAFLMGFQMINLADSLHLTVLHFVAPDTTPEFFGKQLAGSFDTYDAWCVSSAMLFCIIAFFTSLIGVNDKTIMHQPRLIRWLYFKAKE